MRRIISLAIVMTIAGTVNLMAAKKSDIVKSVRNAKGIEVSYKSSYGDRTMPGATLMTVIGKEAMVEATPRPEGSRREGRMMPETKTYLDYATGESYRVATLPDGEMISCRSAMDMNKEFTAAGEEKYLGLNCKVVRTSLNSNSVEIWYTTEIPFCGTPNPAPGVPDGLVVRVIINGEMKQEATEITPVKEARNLFPESWGTVMEPHEYQYALNQANVITVPVFDQERISFNQAKAPDVMTDGEVYNVGGGTIILRKVKLPDNADHRNVFVEAVQYSDGDAYDRTGSVFMIPTDKKESYVDAIRNLNSVASFHSGDRDYHALVSTPDYTAPMELMRFFTGFGVRAYNERSKVPGQEWVDSVNYKTEVTSLADRLTGEQWIGAYIGNYDGKGHKLSVKLKYYPGGGERKFKAMPLFNTVNYLEQAGQPYPTFLENDSLNVTFTLAEPAENAYLYYLTTGHGGWGGGDEFTQKPNTIMLDGRQVISFVPWREDCATYRNLNPCSGNFANGLSSSDLSRSNWCPGTVTTPEYIYLGNLDAGEHTITVKIPQGKAEGNRISYWCISGTLLY